MKRPSLFCLLLVPLLAGLVAIGCATAAAPTATPAAKPTAAPTAAPAAKPAAEPAAKPAAAPAAAPAAKPAAAPAAAPDAAALQKAAEFFKGKTVNVVVRVIPGGGFDTQTRTVVPFFEQLTGAKVTVRNMPGGGGLEAANALFDAQPDGLTIELVGHGPKLITSGLFGAQGVRYKFDQFTPLGRVMYSPVMFFVPKSKPWTKPQDLVGEKFIAGSTSPFYEPLYAEALGWEGMKVVPGMGTPERALAMRRGEIQGSVGGVEVMTADPDLLKPILITVKAPEAPGVPPVREVALPDRKKWAGYLEAWDDVMYWAIAPPKLPEDRALFLEDVLRKISQNPEYVKAAQKIGMQPQFVTAKQLKQTMTNLASLNQADIKEMEYVINEKYVRK